MLWTGSKYIVDGFVLWSASDPTVEVVSDFQSGSGSLKMSRISEISLSDGVVLLVVASN